MPNLYRSDENGQRDAEGLFVSCSACDYRQPFREADRLSLRRNLRRVPMWAYNSTDNGSHYCQCEDCGAEYLVCEGHDECREECEYCGDYYWPSDGPCCEAPWGYGDSGRRGIYDYSYRPTLIWHRTPEETTRVGDHPVPYYLGMELEIRTESRDAEPIYEWARSVGYDDLFYCKDDSSVAGFEIVTHPMSPAFVEAFNWAAFFDMLNNEYPLPAQFHGEESRDHGLHVHVSRTAFNRSPVMLGAWTHLLTSEANWPHVVEIARRESGDWGPRNRQGVRDAEYSTFAHDLPEVWQAVAALQFTRDDDASGWMYRDAFTGAKVSQHSRRAKLRNMGGNSRYQAINFQNCGTVEVRAFRSTRDADEFAACLGLVIASVEYVRGNATIAQRPVRDILDWQAFANYVTSNLAPFYHGAVTV